MDKQLVDLGFIYQLSDNDSRYVYDVLSIFLNTIPDKLTEFTALVKKSNPDDFVQIEEQAHFLKSSSSIVKIDDMYEHLAKIESLAKSKKGLDEILKLHDQIVINFNLALPILLAEQQKNSPSQESI